MILKCDVQHLMLEIILNNLIFYWRAGRAVKCGGLENRRPQKVRGFESLALRQNQNIINTNNDTYYL